MNINKEVLKCWKITENNLKRFKPFPCGHRFPYYIRWSDDYSKSGKMIERHCYCFICEEEHIIRKHPKTLCMERLPLGFDKGRETIDKLRKELPKIIIGYIYRIKKNYPEKFA